MMAAAVRFPARHLAGDADSCSRSSSLALALGWPQLVLEEKPDPSRARVVVEREVIPDGLVRIAWDNFLYDPNIPRESWYRGHIFVHTNAISELIVGHHLP